jgi:hypothetical protein
MEECVIKEEKGSISEIIVGETKKIKEYTGVESGMSWAFSTGCSPKHETFHNREISVS